jgi:hypothetical protein
MPDPMRVVPTSPASFPADWMTTPTFCYRCEIHQATNREPLCPICLDDDARAER